MQVHCVPNNDERPHQFTDQCWCGPHVEWIDPDTGLPYPSGCKVVHFSADSRETSEHITGESVAPGLNWAVVVVEN